LIFEFDLNEIKMNQQATHLGQRSFSSKVIVRTHTQTGPIAILDHQSGR